MKKKTPYKIDIVGLSFSKHDYSLVIDNQFFEEREYEDIHSANCVVNLFLDKTEYRITASFEIKGTVGLVCDRSLEKFNHPIDISKQIIFKYSDTEEEVDDELFYITKTQDAIDFRDVLFEIISIEIPIKKTHPKFKNKDEDEDEAKEVLIYSSEDDCSLEENNDICDSRWDSLKNLKFDN